MPRPVLQTDERSECGQQRKDGNRYQEDGQCVDDCKISEFSCPGEHEHDETEEGCCIRSDYGPAHMPQGCLQRGLSPQALLMLPVVIVEEVDGPVYAETDNQRAAQYSAEIQRDAHPSHEPQGKLQRDKNGDKRDKPPAERSLGKRDHDEHDDGSENKTLRLALIQKLVEPAEHFMGACLIYLDGP